MKFLTIRQPWADAICYLGKRVENRNWSPPASNIGDRIALHAGAAFDTAGAAAMREHMDRTRVTANDPVFTAMFMVHARERRGVIVATAILEDVVTASDSPWFCGPVGWVFRDVFVLEAPVRMRGSLGLRHLPRAAEEVLRAAIGTTV